MTDLLDEKILVFVHIDSYECNTLRNNLESLKVDRNIFVVDIDLYPEVRHEWLIKTVPAVLHLPSQKVLYGPFHRQKIIDFFATIS